MKDLTGNPEKRWPLAKAFHENSKYCPETLFEQTRIIRDFSANLDQIYESSQAGRCYSALEKVPLKRFRIPLLGKSIWSLLKRRRSARAFGAESIPLGDLARVLRASAGITGTVPIPKTNGLEQTFRSYPSAGAQYALESYFVSFEAGKGSVYHYEPRQDCLRVFPQTISQEQFVRRAAIQEELRETPVYVVVTAMMERTLKKYGERGYRFVWMETGHLAQNLLLTAAALGLGACPLGRFLDDEVKQTLGIDDREEVLYLIAMGRPKHE